MIVIGGSWGGCDALGEILRRLPRDFALPVVVVLHRHRESEGLLQPVLQRTSALPVVEPEDKTIVEPGYVYICPPDYHLTLQGNYFSLIADELVNFARPSIDVLFESAAEWYRERTIAVVLSGGGSDGAAGAARIQAAGGRVIVQNPESAVMASMPAAALARPGPRDVYEVPAIAELLIRLSVSTIK